MSTIDVEGMAFEIIRESGNVVDLRERNEETMSVYCFFYVECERIVPYKSSRVFGNRQGFGVMGSQKDAWWKGSGLGTGDFVYVSSNQFPFRRLRVVLFGL